MRRDIRQYLGKEYLFYDGGTGTYLQSHGLRPGELPESWNTTHRETMIEMHESFLEAGSHILLTNTFGINAGKLQGTGLDLEELVSAAVENAREAVRRYEEKNGNGRPLFVSLDIGPSGHLMKPYGDLEFEEACEWFRQVAVCGERAGVDLVTIETMSDSYEVKAALLAVKEHTSLPVFVTMVFDEGGRLLTGGEIPGTAALLEGLGADAVGLNCGLGPYQMEKLAEIFLSSTSLPVIVNPNAGLPRTEGGKTVYDIGAEEFGTVMERIGEKGAWVLGGCCGTTASYIRATAERLKGKKPVKRQVKERTLVTSGSGCVEIGEDPVIIGERINPTGKKWLKEALTNGDTDRILREALKEEEDGAHILDVNAGLPGLSEADKLKELIPALQAVTNLPLQIDTSDAAAMEQAVRLYNGKPMLNSVNGKRESMEAIFPIVKKYGGVVVGLCLDEDGIPADDEGRIQVARKIIDTAASYGIEKKDIVIDALALTVSADAGSAAVTLRTLKRLKEELGVATVLGVSNISFGLPAREVINAAFYAMALQNGLSCGIINPASQAMRDSYDSYRALCGFDKNCGDYIARNAGRKTGGKAAQDAAVGIPSPESGRKGEAFTSKSVSREAGEALRDAIEKGLSKEAGGLTETLLRECPVLSIIDGQLIPALDTVGKRFERGTLFLPQLLMSADAAGAAFEVIRTHLEKSGQVQQKKGKIVIATVKGDIHDIGKNIVKALLQNYGYEVLDLGKDVEPQRVVDAVRESGAALVGLSALMTTTVVYMEETIRQLRAAVPGVKIMVGGAVLNPEYAVRIGADFYGSDAMASVRYAEEMAKQGVFG
ncbi:MAG: dihydropteroate synthase [Lachnospiraceae bacterium]|nr:dihydropteroate synthase [Lachnospiraceae bacterium]